METSGIVVISVLVDVDLIEAGTIVYIDLWNRCQNRPGQYKLR